MCLCFGPDEAEDVFLFVSLLACLYFLSSPEDGGVKQKAGNTKIKGMLLFVKLLKNELMQDKKIFYVKKCKQMRKKWCKLHKIAIADPQVIHTDTHMWLDEKLKCVQAPLMEM